MIELRNVTKTYQLGKKSMTAVDDVSLTIETAEIFGIIGYSGAGKSTLLRCINRLEQPTSGQIWVGSQEITSLSKRGLQKARTKIGMIFQHFHLLHSVTVAENIAFPLRLAKAKRQDITHRVKELLDLVGLSGYENRYPGELSGGQKQRVAIARALANNPEVLLCDEATSALDPETTRSILDLLVDLHERLGLTVVLVTHQMSVIRRVCDRVAVMDQGQVVESGSVAEVFLQPRHPVTKRLVQSEDDDASALGIAPGTAQYLEITYVGDAAYQPVLAEVAQVTRSTFSILQGHIGTLKDVPYGKLRVAWSGDEAVIRRAVEELEQRGCTVNRFTEGVRAEEVVPC